VDDGWSAIGGGTTPGLELPSRVVSLAHRHRGADWLDSWLRAQDPPIVGRIDHDRLVIDLRTVLEDDDKAVTDALEGIPR
jgi:L-seryl-tRNA(Ser) seleniumtransferase